MLGSMLYTIGGYIAPFYIVGTICLLILPLLQFTLKLLNEEENIKSPSE